MSIISDVERQVRARLEELQPAVDEYRQLEEVARTFERARHPDAPQTAQRPRARNRRRPKAASSTSGRADQALSLVADHPGITVGELAEQMSIGTTYLYRVMPSLERDGRVRKVGKGYELADPAPATS